MNFQPLLSAREFLGVIHGRSGIHIDKRIPLYDGVGKRLAIHNTDSVVFRMWPLKAVFCLKHAFTANFMQHWPICIF